MTRLEDSKLDTEIELRLRRFVDNAREVAEFHRHQATHIYVERRFCIISHLEKTFPVIFNKYTAILVCALALAVTSLAALGYISLEYDTSTGSSLCKLLVEPPGPQTSENVASKGFTVLVNFDGYLKVQPNASDPEQEVASYLPLNLLAVTELLRSPEKGPVGFLTNLDCVSVSTILEKKDELYRISGMVVNFKSPFQAHEECYLLPYHHRRWRDGKEHFSNEGETSAPCFNTKGKLIATLIIRRLDIELDRADAETKVNKFSTRALKSQLSWKKINQRKISYAIR